MTLAALLTSSLRSLFLLLLAYYSLALFYHFFKRQFSTLIKKPSLSDKTLMVVLGSGGHTTEMLQMLDGLQVAKYGHVCLVLGHSDTWSLTKLQASQTLQLSQVTLVRLFRAREVKQSYLTSVASTLVGFVHACWIVVKNRPDLIVTNGPGTAVPLCYASFILQKCLLTKPDAKLLFVESFCRVKTLSLTGKLLKPIADK